MLKKEDHSYFALRHAVYKTIRQGALETLFLMSTQSIITIEDGVISGGFGSAILEFRNQHDLTSSIKILGLPDSFIEHGTQKELYQELGLDSLGIFQTIKAELN